MKAHRFKISTIVLMMLTSILFMGISCKEEPLVEDNKTEEGIAVKVQINFKVPQLDTPQATPTRSVGDNSKQFHLSLNEEADGNEAEKEKKIGTRADGKPLYNLWVFQFDTDGKTRKATKVSTTDKPINENVTIDVDLFIGKDQTIYLLSLGKQYGDKDLIGIKTLTDLETTSFDFVRYEDGLPVAIINNEDDVPYRGSCSGVTIIQLEKDGFGYVDYNQSAGFNGGIKMRALVSMVTFDCSYAVTGMTPSMLQMNNVPATFVVNDNTYKPNQFVNLPAIEFAPTDLSGGKRYVAKWYIAPNHQGTVTSITKEVDRYFYYTLNTNSEGAAPRDGTYIQFWAAKDGNPDNYALYYMFLGSNLTSDFNVNPHSHYRYRTDINTADDTNDKRIVFKTLKQSIDFAASNFTDSAPLLRGGNGYDLSAYPEMRPIEITALRGTVTVEVLENKADTSPIDPSNTWLRLSTYSNYTAAFNGRLSGDKNALATTITLNASTPGLFRLYLYSDEYEKYVSENSSYQKRSLFVRFTFQTSTGTSQTYTTQMNQRPAFYLGQFGGNFVSNDDEAYYSEGLVMEDPNSSRKLDYLSYMPSSWQLPRAYVGILEDEGYDIHDGRTTTINMAENKFGLSDISEPATATIAAPRYVNGHVDLYQYKYYTGDGFAQRWCYDRNRDENGNGYLEEDEIKWYWGASNQILATSLSHSVLKSRGFELPTASAITMNGANGVVYSNPLNITPTEDRSKQMRCVRNVHVQKDSPEKGISYYADKEGYAVIDATGLLKGMTEDRVNSSDLYDRGRVKRYYYTGEATNTIDYKVSQRFRVAPTDIKANGDAGFEHMTWAEAAGYNTAVNTKPIDTAIDDIAETGCFMYKGKDGKDASGTWRLPTVRESILIGMMDETMRSKNAKTGYVGLSNMQKGQWVDHYWTANEKKDGSNEYSKNIAYNFSIATASRAKYNKSIYQINDSMKKGNNGGTGKCGARCIQDLH